MGEGVCRAAFLMGLSASLVLGSFAYIDAVSASDFGGFEILVEPGGGGDFLPESGEAAIADPWIQEESSGGSGGEIYISEPFSESAPESALEYTPEAVQEVSSPEPEAEIYPETYVQGFDQETFYEAYAPEPEAAESYESLWTQPEPQQQTYEPEPQQQIYESEPQQQTYEPEPTAAPAPLPTATPTPSPTLTPIPTPTATPMPSLTPSPTPTPTTQTPTPTPSLTPTLTPAPTPSPIPASAPRSSLRLLPDARTGQVRVLALALPEVLSLRADAREIPWHWSGSTLCPEASFLTGSGVCRLDILFWSREEGFLPLHFTAQIPIPPRFSLDG